MARTFEDYVKSYKGRKDLPLDPRDKRRLASLCIDHLADVSGTPNVLKDINLKHYSEMIVKAMENPELRESIYDFLWDSRYENSLINSLFKSWKNPELQEITSELIVRLAGDRQRTLDLAVQRLHIPEEAGSAKKLLERMGYLEYSIGEEFFLNEANRTK